MIFRALPRALSDPMPKMTGSDTCAPGYFGLLAVMKATMLSM